MKFDTVPRHNGTTFQPINFKVMSDMVPSARLLVYYIMTGETTAELVADSVWMGVKDKCVSDLQVNITSFNFITRMEVSRPRNSLFLFSPSIPR